MNHRILFTGLMLAGALALAGCGGGGGSKPTAPVVPPAGTLKEAEPNDWTPQALGALGSTDLVLAGAVASLEDVDLYSVTLSAPAGLYVNVGSTPGAAVELSLSNAAGVFVRKVAETAGGLNTCQLAGLPAGTYVIRVDALAATGYTLTVGQR